jgi:tetratricopeptide (TPR) repeat protein
MAPRARYVRAVGPRLKRLLAVVFGLLALLAVDSIYLVSVTAAGTQYQSWFYMIMFLLHLVLGLLLVGPVIAFGAIHIRNAWNRPNRRAIRFGYALFAMALMVFGTGFVLMRVDLFGWRLEINNPFVRSAAYWLHVVGPVVAVWLFVLHRLAGPGIKWKAGLSWAGAAAVFAAVMLALQAQDPRAWNVEGPKSGEKYFFPSLARTSTGNFIPVSVLKNDTYCGECHRGFCAGCHDPVPFFSGAFDDPRFDDPEFDLASDLTAQAGITCTVCHSISHINSVRGNSDYTIDEPVHYPFAFSENRLLGWINRQLIKAKPEFHKATFLKPLHRSAEFCGTCHKVHLPPELNDYKWLRGQNHYDAFWLSGVSGQGISSFYYPLKAEKNCNGCHMPLEEVSGRPNFGAKVRDDSGEIKTFNHQFPSANTAIPYLVRDKLDDADAAIEAHREFLEGVMRVDIFGLREDGRIDGRLIAPVRPDVPVLKAGRTYLLETVIRTVKMGHVFTQGTADSNEVWMDVTVTSDDRVIGRSGGREPRNNSVDPWSHYVNAFVLDREGNRINQRNAQDIFVALYNNQIPPGAADVIHYSLRLPPDVTEPVTVDVRLQFRKFDTEYMSLVTNDENYFNDLPVTTLASDRVTFPVDGSSLVVPNNDSPIELWQRWNDYGIGLLRKGQLGELRQAAEAFRKVEELGRPDGPVNLARVHIREGLLQTHAPDDLERAAKMTPPAYEWTLLWLGARVAELNGDFDKAIENLRDIVRGGFKQAEGRGFDFSKDYRVLSRLAGALYQVGLQVSGAEREKLMLEAAEFHHIALRYDPENLHAHWGLKQIYRDLGDAENERKHTALHAKYKPDDNARDYAVARARIRYPAANHAAEAVVIYDLHRPGAPGLNETAVEPEERMARTAP